MVNIYSELRANIQDSFYEEGLEIMSRVCFMRCVTATVRLSQISFCPRITAHQLFR